MAYIENEAKLAGEELSTLRFYFANYPDQDKFPDGKEVVHRRQNSIMMSPTVKRNDKDYIFYTDDAGEGKRRIVLLKNDKMSYNNRYYVVKERYGSGSNLISLKLFCHVLFDSTITK